MAEYSKFWDDRADRYAKQPIKDVAGYERTLDRTRKYLSATDEVLEIGCGTGTTALLLAPSVARVTASDLSGRMIEIGREKAAAEGVENVVFEHATVFDDAFAEGTFDVVLAFNLLHLLEDLPGALRRVHALLKPGGRFVSKTVCTAQQSVLWGLVIGAMRLVGLAPYVRALKFAELEGMLRHAGFEIVETEACSGTVPRLFVVARKG